jgi:hypothetical protein
VHLLEKIKADPLSKNRRRRRTRNETSLHDSHTEKHYRCAYGYIESFLSNGPIASGPDSPVMWQTCPVQCRTNLFASWLFNTFQCEASSLWNSKISKKSYQNCNRRLRILLSGFNCLEVKRVSVLKVTSNTYCNVRWTYITYYTSNGICGRGGMRAVKFAVSFGCFPTEPLLCCSQYTAIIYLENINRLYTMTGKNAFTEKWKRVTYR